MREAQRNALTVGASAGERPGAPDPQHALDFTLISPAAADRFRAQFVAGPPTPRAPAAAH
jgi:hypothetical protein